MTGRLRRGYWHSAGVIALEPDADEKAWMAEVIRTAEQLGWHRYYHTFDSRRSPAGFLDLVLLRPPRLVFAELKVGDGRVTKDQAGWIADLRACGLEVYVWRPADRPQVDAILASRRRP